jgi:hypothetical protein
MPAIGGLNFQPNPPNPLSGYGQAAYQQFQYTSQVDLSQSFSASATFTFPVPPMGYVWIGSFLPCVAQTVVDFESPILAAAAWQLNRNGQPLLSWVGYTSLTNFQANATDVIEILGFNLPFATVSLTWIGYAYPTNLAPPVLPSYNTSGQALDTLINSFAWSEQITVSMASGNGSFSHTYFAPNLLVGYQTSMFSIELWCLQYCNNTTGAVAGFCGLQDTSLGVDIHTIAVGGLGAAAANQSVDLSNNPYPLALNSQVTLHGSGFFVGAGASVTAGFNVIWGPTLVQE